MFKSQMDFDTNISHLINYLYNSNTHGPFVEAYVAHVTDNKLPSFGIQVENTQHRVIIDKHSKCSTVMLLIVYWKLARNASYLVVAVTFINRQILNALRLMKNHG
jgi:hypothetical protein